MDVWLLPGWGLAALILLLLGLAYAVGRADGYRQGRSEERAAAAPGLAGLEAIEQDGAARQVILTFRDAPAHGRFWGWLVGASFQARREETG